MAEETRAGAGGSLVETLPPVTFQSLAFKHLHAKEDHLRGYFFTALKGPAREARLK